MAKTDKEKVELLFVYTPRFNTLPLNPDKCHAAIHQEYGKNSEYRQCKRIPAMEIEGHQFCLQHAKPIMRYLIARGTMKKEKGS